MFCRTVSILISIHALPPFVFLEREALARQTSPFIKPHVYGLLNGVLTGNSLWSTATGESLRSVPHLFRSPSRVTFRHTEVTKLRQTQRKSNNMNALRETFLDELADVYDAEKQLLKALPKMAKAAE